MFSLSAQLTKLHTILFQRQNDVRFPLSSRRVNAFSAAFSRPNSGAPDATSLQSSDDSSFALCTLASGPEAHFPFLIPSLPVGSEILFFAVASPNPILGIARPRWPCRQCRAISIFEQGH